MPRARVGDAGVGALRVPLGRLHARAVAERRLGRARVAELRELGVRGVRVGRLLGHVDVVRVDRVGLILERGPRVPRMFRVGRPPIARRVGLRPLERVGRLEVLPDRARARRAEPVVLLERLARGAVGELRRGARVVRQLP